MRRITSCDTPTLMSYDIHSIDDLIDELGGPTVMGGWLGITSEAVSNWKARQNIPAGWHWKLAAAARKKGKRVHPRVFGLDEDEAPFLNVAFAATA